MESESVDSVHRASFCKANDMWAVATLLYFMLYGCWPFTKEEQSSWETTSRENWSDDANVWERNPNTGAMRPHAHVVARTLW